MIIGTVKSVYDLDLDFLKTLSIKALVCDLDQTLSSAFSSIPDAKVFQLKDELESRGIKLIVLSNNFSYRVKKFCIPLKVDYLAFSLKFTTFRVLHYLKKLNLDVKDCVFVGDQMRTDGKLTDKLNAKFILTQPLEEKDNLFTKYHRKKDLKTIEDLRKRHQLGKELPSKTRR